MSDRSAPDEAQSSAVAGAAASATADERMPLLPGMLMNRGTRESRKIDEFMKEALAAVRRHLDMDVAFVSEFTDGRRIYRYVDASSEAPPVRTGESDPLEDTYCQRVVEGAFPAIMGDTSEFPEAMALPVTKDLNIRSHIGVPIRLPNGKVYGTFCCYSTRPDSSLNERDVRVMRVFADLLARRIERKRASDKAREEAQVRIESLLRSDGLTAVYQPIFDVAEARVVGFEALARFPAESDRAPDAWFNEAAEVGLGVALEIHAVKKQLAGLAVLPQDVYLSLNVSPETVISGELTAALEGMPLERLLLEITEHSFIREYPNVESVLRPLRERGLRVAVDDAGAGYASFRHILRLAPDVIKLDTSLTRDIDTDRAERALASALIRFAEEMNSVIVSEGVETHAELETLHRLGVVRMQGFLLGRPVPLDQAAALCAQPTGFAAVAQDERSAAGI